MSFAVKVNKLNYHYSRLAVLKELSFDIPSGNFFTIIGPNGSGKTTLIKILAGILKPLSGQIDISGQNLKQYTPKNLAKKISYVPQSVEITFPFTVLEVVLMGRSPHHGILALENQYDLDLAYKAMAFTSVEALAHRKADQLSGGEQQRVIIARAICQEPQIILLDEPTASLDIAHQVKIMDLMEKLKTEKKMTVIMVSHDVNLAAMYADTILLMNKGRIVKIGPTAKVLTYTILEKIYGCKILVDTTPLGGYPRITPVPAKYQKITDSKPLSI